ncbi:MAG: methyltransferase domain-containing protein [Myxococcota bacterium]
MRSTLDAWIAAARGRYAPPLTFSEVRRGVQALSSLYVERRGQGRLAARAADGAAKRCALASYYAPLHFLSVCAALDAIEAASPPDRILDLGCGTGAAGAAAARSLAPRAAVLGLDASAWALGEARHTYRAFGIAGRTRRGRVPQALPKPRRGDWWVAGWIVNELSRADREELLATIHGALDLGVSLLVLEPLSLRTSPWWPQWRAALEPHGARERLVRTPIARPDWIEALDRATRLDHRTLGARVLVRTG